MAKKNKKKDQLTYFLDHPQIKRHESPGNGNAPGSIADKINFGGKGTAAPAPSRPASSSTSASSGSSSPSIAKQINWPGAKK